jgi:beta-galactosidase
MKLTLSIVCLSAAFVFHSANAQVSNDALVQASSNPRELAIPDSGWRLWPDTQASWQNDQLYLPYQVDLTKLPVNPPTGGWSNLTSSNGIPVKLPASVEQYYWGKLSLRPYNNSAGWDEYDYAFNDTEIKNGAYQGVSWFWRAINVPSSFNSSEVTLHIRGFRQRVEVYVNQQLVGYDLIAETAYDCNIAKALKPGQTNTIALRITNPGGNYDWIDFSFSQIKWGNYSFHAGRGIGGLDRGLTITAHDSLFLSDTWTLNTPETTTIKAFAEIQNDLPQNVPATVRFEVVDRRTGAILTSADALASVTSNQKATVNAALTLPNAKLWSPDSPELYTLRSILIPSNSFSSTPNQRDVAFGFRWFTPQGIGQNAILTSNGQRTRLYSAISWGWWGFSGLWPTPALAKKEVDAAKGIGLNCLQFHRDLGKTEALDAADEGGLFRYMEPGGGETYINDQPGSFGQLYEEQRILRMVHDHRSHPSLIIYSVQNELGTGLNNPATFQIISEIHQADPSRTVVLKSGGVASGEAFYLPYATQVSADDGTGYSGWADSHTVGGPGVWQDSLYTSPTNFVQYTNNQKEIVVWGETLGAAVPDNHQDILESIEQGGGQSYDKTDHQEILDAYNQFLDKWNFRSAFPAARDLFTAIGNKAYDFWGRVTPTIRLADATDYLVLSGWESNPIENHSGIVDDQRNFKGDLSLISPGFNKLRPVVEPHGLVHKTGDMVTLDLFLLNETNLPASGKLNLTVTTPSGKTLKLATFQAPSFVAQQFVYPILQDFPIPALTEEGHYKIRFTIDNGGGRQSAVGESDLFAINPTPKAFKPLNVGIVGLPDFLGSSIPDVTGVSTSGFTPGQKYDVLVAGGPSLTTNANGTSDPIKNTNDAPLYQSQLWGGANQLGFYIDGLPSGTAQVTLKFAEIFWNGPGQRVFDVAINGKIVLSHFDMLAAAGGKDIAIDKTFTVPVVNGIVTISAPAVYADNAEFQAVEIVAGGVTKAYHFGTTPYTDSNGLIWLPYTALPTTTLNADVIAAVKAGTPILVLASGSSIADHLATQLAGAGAFNYSGQVGDSRAPWMGSWVFLRSHPAYDGLPTNTAMNWEYQVDTASASGLLIDGAGVNIIAAYSRDHDRHIGAATFTAPLGQGTVLFQAVRNMQPQVYERFITDSLTFLKNNASTSNGNSSVVATK